MIVNLRESKANLSALVDQVSKGDEVIITVHGKPKARLCPIAPALNEQSKKQWAARVQENWDTYTVKTVDSSKEIIDELRGDRN